MAKRNLNLSRASEHVRYCPEGGLLTWLDSGLVAGRADNTEGYIRLSIAGVSMYAHRVAWTLSHGEIPDGMQIDHIDGNRTDNRLCNLRVVTHAENTRNTRQPHGGHSVSGLLGVSWHKTAKKWQAKIRLNRATIHIGYFSDKHEAHEAYLAKKRDIHPTCSL